MLCVVSFSGVVGFASVSLSLGLLMSFCFAWFQFSLLSGFVFGFSFLGFSLCFLFCIVSVFFAVMFLSSVSLFLGLLSIGDFLVFLCLQCFYLPF